MVGASRLPGYSHDSLSKLFRYLSGWSDLDWPASARASPTESVKMPSTGEEVELARHSQSKWGMTGTSDPTDQKNAP